MSFYSRLKILFVNRQEGPERVPCFSKWCCAGEGNVPALHDGGGLPTASTKMELGVTRLSS
jgi:hypothetical protein